MFAEVVANRTVQQLPKFTSVERSLKKRGKGNIYIDYLQNKSGQTLSCVYSARPKPGATVSTPLEWEEVRPGLSPRSFHIKNIIQRIEQKGDLFAPVLRKAINMEKALKLIGI
jgi:bifunctional non-homologous end joining protein LigD